MVSGKKRVQKLQLALAFAAVLFLILLVTMCILFAGIFVLHHLGLPLVDEGARVPLFLFALTSLILGTLLAFLFSRRPLKPIYILGEAADRIAAGDYTARANIKGPEELMQLAERFNHMAQELGSVELLRNDFIHNFSHEFKTPIVSIRGFAKILKQEELACAERNEYLDIIIDESERLAALSDHVLYLSKIEQQTILTDKSKCNVSEQIRLVIAMLDSKWGEKQINFRFDCGEFYITANEAMLKQIWINLLDNAIKFSPPRGTVEIQIKKEERFLCFQIKNSGCGIQTESAEHIFDKFYQGDLSHAAKGYGLGLPIVKKVVELHQGSVILQSSNERETVFQVKLPVDASLS